MDYFKDKNGNVYFGDKRSVDDAQATPDDLLRCAVPAAVSMRQARLALLDAGMLADVDAAVASMPGVEGDAARIEWEYAATVGRSSPLVASLAVALSLTQAQLDALFVQAAGL